MLIIFGAGCAALASACAGIGPTPSPTFHEIMPLPNTAAATETATPSPFPSSPAGLPGSAAPDLVIYVRTSLAPPLCFDAHSKVGALVNIGNAGTADAGPFMVEADGVWQAAPEGLAAGQWRELWFDARAFPQPWERMTVTVDAAKQVAESDETNNTVTEPVATLTPPLPCPTATP